MTQWGLDALFNPAKRHMDEEKQRLQSTREEVGDSSGGKRIDLGSGKVVIEREAKDDEETVAETPADHAAAQAEESTGGQSTDEPSSGGPTTAAERARLRHRNRRAGK